MNPILLTAALTVAAMLLTGAFFGSSGAYYLVTTAGLPHFILGFVFAAVSIARGRPARRRALGGLALISVAACLFYARFPIFDLVGAYFVVHMFRDEVFMFLNRRSGFDAAAVGHASTGESASSPALQRAWIAGRVFLVVSLAAFALGRLAIMQRRPRPGLFSDPASHLTGSVPLDLAVGGGVALLLVMLALVPRQGLALLHLPVEARDFLALFVCVAFAAQLREATLFLALFHYISWYLFYGEKLRTLASGSPASSRWSWRAMMTQPRPFTALMVSANVTAALLLAAYLAWPNSLWPLAAGYEYEFFPYWTIPHVTLSFVPGAEKRGLSRLPAIAAWQAPSAAWRGLRIPA